MCCDSPNLKGAEQDLSQHKNEPSTEGVDGVVESHWRLSLQPPHSHLHEYQDKEIRKHLSGSGKNSSTHNMIIEIIIIIL